MIITQTSRVRQFLYKINTHIILTEMYAEIFIKLSKEHSYKCLLCTEKMPYVRFLRCF